MSKSETKEQILKKIIETVDKQIEASKQAVSAAKESRDNESKCSAGDKYEVGRTMVQLELEKSRVLLNKSLKLKNELTQLDLKRKHERVNSGSLVITNQGNYFISIGVGKIEIENRLYYAISLASPIGEKLYGKSKGETLSFQGKEIEILEIL
jgi:hypothetical protein